MKVMCKYCGAAAFNPYMGICNISPNKHHEWMPIYEGLDKPIDEDRGDRRRDALQEQQSQEQMRIAQEQNEILAEQAENADRRAKEQNAISARQAETAVRLAEEATLQRKSQAEQQQAQEEQKLDRKLKNFLVLIRHNDLAEIKTILREGAFDVNHSVFVVPVYLGESNPTTEYLREFVEIDAKDAEGMTALHHAAKAGNLDTVERLLTLGANIDAQASNGETALLIAISVKQVGLATRLIDLHANLKLADSKGFTPLIGAAFAGSEILTERLIELGADINAQTKSGTNVILSACAGGQVSVIKILMEHNACRDIKGEEGYLLLRTAASLGRYRACKYLVEAGCPVDSPNLSGETALFCSLSQLQAFITKPQWLISNGYFCASDIEERIPEYVKIAELLVNAGTNVNAKNKDGNTALPLLEKYTSINLLPSSIKGNRKQRTSSTTCITQEATQPAASTKTCGAGLKDQQSEKTGKPNVTKVHKCSVCKHYNENRYAKMGFFQKLNFEQSHMECCGNEEAIRLVNDRSTSKCNPNGMCRFWETK